MDKRGGEKGAEEHGAGGSPFDKSVMILGLNFAGIDRVDFR